MKSFFRSTCAMIMIIAAACIITGCARKPPAAESVSPPPFAAAAPGDRNIIVAKVNGADITLYSLINMMKRMDEINQKTSSSESREETRKKAMDQLIFRELAFQEAVRQGLHVEERRINYETDKFITSMGHEQGYNDFLAKENITPAEVRSEIERNLLLQLVATREVMEKTSVADDEAQKEYEQQKDRYVIPEKVTVVDVVFFLKQDSQTAMKKADEILVKINADKDKNPRNLVPDDTFAVRSLDIQKEKEPALYAAARKLKQGELSGVIKTGDSVHILQLTQYTPEKQMSYEEAKGLLEKKLNVIAQLKRFAEWEQELKKDAKIEIMEEGRGQEPAVRSQKADGGKD